MLECLSCYAVCVTESTHWVNIRHSWLAVHVGITFCLSDKIILLSYLIENNNTQINLRKDIKLWGFSEPNRNLQCNTEMVHISNPQLPIDHLRLFYRYRSCAPAISFFVTFISGRFHEPNVVQREVTIDQFYFKYWQWHTRNIPWYRFAYGYQWIAKFLYSR